MEKQNKYIEKVRDSYTPHERTKLDELRELDKRVKIPSMVFAYVFGSVAALIFGVGIALCIANYFIYNALLNSRKKKYGNKIVALSNELLDN